MYDMAINVEKGEPRPDVLCAKNVRWALVGSDQCSPTAVGLGHLQRAGFVDQDCVGSPNASMVGLLDFSDFFDPSALPSIPVGSVICSTRLPP